mgnify:CR=1 FL=1
MAEVDTKNNINEALIRSSMNFEEYLNLLNELYEQGKTTGENQSVELLNYAKLNLQRMKRLNKTVSISDQLLSVINATETPKMIWLVLTEGWCGDAAQNIPVLNKLAQDSDKIELKFILRDEHLAIMDQFLTNGGRSIPKLIALNPSDLSVLGTWGPRPKPSQELINEFKLKNPDAPFSELAAALQLWYARDKTQAQQVELIECINKWAEVYNK